MTNPIKKNSVWDASLYNNHVLGCVLNKGSIKFLFRDKFVYEDYFDRILGISLQKNLVLECNLI